MAKAKSEQQEDFQEEKKPEVFGGKIAIMKDGVTRLREESELPEYLADGWVIK